jgi:predicted dinucleotide-binding enzyme
MSHVSIIGGGNMGQAIATIVLKGGNTVEVCNSNDTDKPVTGDVVFLAVPYPAVADVLAQRGDELAGKVLVGITKNPLTFETFDPLVVPADASAAAKSASPPPRPRVLKAFNIVARAGCAPSTRARWPAPASGELPASCRSLSPLPRSGHGPAGSPSPDGLPGWDWRSDEGPSRWWYVGMFVLVLSLFALLTVLYRA